MDMLEKHICSLNSEIAALKKSGIKTIFSLISRKGLIAAFTISVISLSVIIYAATVTNLTTFTAGSSTIIAEDVNANFQIVAPVGSITMYGAATAPTGWLPCYGSAVNKTDYAALYAKIGATFGPEDATTITLPDFRGVFPKGAGTTNRTDGKSANGAFYAGILGTYSTDQMQGHKHDFLIAGIASTSWGSISGSGTSISGATNTTTGFEIGHSITDTTNGTPRRGYTTEPQSLGGGSFIIKY